MTLTKPVDLRLYSALQKLKGFTKLMQDADGNLKQVRNSAEAIAVAMKKMREPIPARPRAHLKVVK